MIHVERRDPYRNGHVLFVFLLDTDEEYQQVWPSPELVCQCKWRDNSERSDGKIIITQTWVPGCTTHKDGILLNYVGFNPESEDFRLGSHLFPVKKTVMK